MASATEQAVKRLEAALEGLETAIARRLASGGDADGRADEVQMLTVDRARLAENLDQAQAHAVRLDNVNREVSRRLAVAVETIRSVLETESSAS